VHLLNRAAISIKVRFSEVCQGTCWPANRKTKS